MVVNSEFKIPTARELFKSFKNPRGEWKLKTPMEKWCYAYSFGRVSYAILRVSLLNDVNRVHHFGKFVLVYVFLTNALSLYTVVYYALHGDLQTGLPSTCAAFILLGVSN